jgi:hypothetical protein
MKLGIESQIFFFFIYFTFVNVCKKLSMAVERPYKMKLDYTLLNLTLFLLIIYVLFLFLSSEKLKLKE